MGKRIYTESEAGLRHLNAQTDYQERAQAAKNDIGRLPIENINWERRLACKESLKLFLETHWRGACKLGWSDAHLEYIARMEDIFKNSGKCAFGMPRGKGKTTVSQGGSAWSLIYGYSHCLVYIGANQDLAERAVANMRTTLFSSRTLLQDFPEIVYPLVKAKNSSVKTRGQLYNGKSTSLSFGADYMHYPAFAFDDEAAQAYRENDPDSVVQTEEGEIIAKSSWDCIYAFGITSSIRGISLTHPKTLSNVRPDIIILDDIQNDKSAASRKTVHDYETLIDGAFEYLSDPETKISALMPCTVINSGDVADTFLNRDLRPEWQGIRVKMVKSWPEGISDTTIDPESKSGALWNQYSELRRRSLRQGLGLSLATDFYIANRVDMDKGIEVSWKDSFNKGKSENDKMREVSAIQAAMNNRFQNPVTFLAECQQIGIDLLQESKPLVSAEEFRKKILPSVKWGTVPEFAHELVAFIDVQDECLFYTVLACGFDFTSCVIQYGIYPEWYNYYFTKAEIARTKWMTNKYIQEHGATATSFIQNEDGKNICEYEARWYWAIDNLVRNLMNTEYIKNDPQHTPMKISAVAIDCQYGMSSSTVRLVCKQLDGIYGNILPYHGEGVSPSRKQYIDYNRGRNYCDYVFEDEKNVNSNECRWYTKIGGLGKAELFSDTWAWKDFLMSRIATPMGVKGCMYLCAEQRPGDHELFSLHVCESEFSRAVQGTYGTRNQWKAREGNPDNDFFDCLVGCCCLSSYMGIRLSHDIVKPGLALGGKGRWVSKK